MPIAYYGSKISPHMTKTPEGFLICHNVPINRVGIYKYPGYQIGIDGADAQNEFSVLRRPEQVFAPAALASFEGKPVTDDHPPDDVTPDNIHIYQKGHVENVHKAADGVHTVADLYITDPDLIREIDSGKREISCGYKFRLLTHKNGSLEQQDMIGNHVAVVTAGRAGPEVRIKDSAGNGGRSDNMPNHKISPIARLAHLLKATDATPEDYEALENLKEPKAEDEEPEPEKEPGRPLKHDAEDEEPDALTALLQKQCGLLEQLIGYVKPEEVEDEDDLSKIAGHKEPDEDEDGPDTDDDGDGVQSSEDEDTDEEDVEVPPEEIVSSKDSMQKMAIGIRDILKKNIPDHKKYLLAAKDAAADLRELYGVKPSGNDGVNKFVQTTKQAQRQRAAQDSDRGVRRIPNHEKMIEEQQKIYDRRNPHMSKEDK